MKRGERTERRREEKLWNRGGKEKEEREERREGGKREKGKGETRGDERGRDRGGDDKRERQRGVDYANSAVNLFYVCCQTERGMRAEEGERTRREWTRERERRKVSE